MTTDVTRARPRPGPHARHPLRPGRPLDTPPGERLADPNRLRARGVLGTLSAPMHLSGLAPPGHAPDGDDVLHRITAVFAVAGCGTDSGPDGRRTWAVVELWSAPSRGSVRASAAACGCGSGRASPASLFPAHSY